MNSDDIVFLVILLLQGCRTFKKSLRLHTMCLLEESLKIEMRRLFFSKV